MKKIKEKLKILWYKLLTFIVVIGKFLISPTIDNPKRKLAQYIVYLIIIVVINFIVGKNITHARYAWYTNVSTFLLVNVNVILILLVMLMIFRNIAKIISESKNNVFGSRLKTKLVIFSVVIAVIPTLVVFFFATTIINISINRWFDSQIDNALSSSLRLMDDYQSMLMNEVDKNTSLLQDTITSNPSLTYDELSNYIANELFSGVALVDNNSNIFYAIDSISDDRVLSFIKTALPVILLNNEKNGIDYIADKQVYWSSTLPFYLQISDNSSGSKFLITYRIIPDRIVEDVYTINGLRDIYSESKYFSFPVKNSYILLLVVLSLIVIFSAVWSSILFAKGITKPIEELADASVLISKGNLDIKVKEQGGDEISYLIKTFNEMVQKLKLHTDELNRKNIILSDMYSQIVKDKMYIDAIFKNVTSSLTLLSEDLRVLESNKQSDAIFANNKIEFTNNILPEITQFAISNDKQMVKNVPMTVENKPKIYSLNVSKISDDKDKQMLLVLDDVTDIVNYQRVTVWQEVATRIAHEVKNPLTPIKLMAERVKKKIGMLNDKKVADIVVESMDTIIIEVDSLLELVEEFSVFARESVIHKSLINLTDIVCETMELYNKTYLNVEFDIKCNGDIFIRADKLKIKRVLQNLITNAIFATNQSGKIIVEIIDDIDSVMIDIVDSGEGISNEDLPYIFNPYFTKRKGGTGLGLAIVKKIIDEHSGEISAIKLEKGMRFSIRLPKGATV